MAGNRLDQIAVDSIEGLAVGETPGQLRDLSPITTSGFVMDHCLENLFAAGICISFLSMSLDRIVPFCGKR